MHNNPVDRGEGRRGGSGLDPWTVRGLSFDRSSVWMMVGPGPPLLLPPIISSPSSRGRLEVPFRTRAPRRWYNFGEEVIIRVPRRYGDYVLSGSGGAVATSTILLLSNSPHNVCPFFFPPFPSFPSIFNDMLNAPMDSTLKEEEEEKGAKTGGKKREGEGRRRSGKQRRRGRKEQKKKSLFAHLRAIYYIAKQHMHAMSEYLSRSFPFSDVLVLLLCFSTFFSRVSHSNHFLDP